MDINAALAMEANAMRKMKQQASPPDRTQGTVDHLNSWVLIFDF